MPALSLMFFLLLTMNACAVIEKNAGFPVLQSITASSFPAKLEWPGVTVTEAEVDARIDTLLRSPLTEEGIIEVAMLSSQELRGTLYGLKAAQGDYLDATSPPNPFVSAVFLDVQDKDLTNLEFGASYELLDLLFLPRRIKISKARFEAAKLDAGRSLVDFATTVRIAYFQALATQQMLELTEQADKVATASANASKALYNAGNIPEVQLNRDKLIAAQTNLEVKRAKQNLISGKENLVRMLGLNAAQAQLLAIKGRLKNPPETEPKVPPLSELSASSLSLASQDARIEAAAIALGITNITSLIGDLELKLVRERDDAHRESGIGSGFELPIFNFGHGKREAASERLRARIQIRMADTVKLSSYARELSSNLETMRNIVQKQRQDVLPLADKVLQGSQLDYNAMQIGVFGLLNAKREQLAAGQSYIAALRDYWTVRARLDQLIAGGSSISSVITKGISKATNDIKGDL